MIAGVKLEVMRPTLETPDEGAFEVCLDTVPGLVNAKLKRRIYPTNLSSPIIKCITTRDQFN